MVTVHSLETLYETLNNLPPHESITIETTLSNILTLCIECTLDYSIHTSPYLLISNHDRSIIAPVDAMGDLISLFDVAALFDISQDAYVWRVNNHSIVT